MYFSFQMNNQFSGLNVHPAGVQGGNSPNLIQGNTNQFSAANIKGDRTYFVFVVFFIAVDFYSLEHKTAIKRK